MGYLIQRLKEIEERAFTAPYNWFVKRGIITVMMVSNKVYMTMEDLYEKKYLQGSKILLYSIISFNTSIFKIV